jgi:glutamate-ammonia-ligase adenylyltransferase
MLRLACGDLLGLIDVTNIARGLTSIAETSITAAYDAAVKQVTAERGGYRARLAVIGMGRLGGAEFGYSSDADVMYVGGTAPGEDEQEARADAAAVADLMGRLLGRPTPDPPLEIDANLRPEGKNGPLVRTLESYRVYWARFAAPWERQALLRARPVAGDEELGADFMAAANSFRYPEGGLSTRDVVEIRRIKARVDTERMPRGADPTTHTKLGRGGLGDVEWTIQLLQLQHAAEIPGLRTPRTLAAIGAAMDAGLLSEADAGALGNGWLVASRTRNAIMLVRGKPDDQIPRQGRELAAVARALGYPAGGDPGEFVDDYRRATRRARKVVDRVFDGG